MATLRIGKLAKLAGISVRTLRHYDAIGLLQASARSASDYRCYDRDDAIRLQQILFYREMEMPLQQIKAVLDDSGFDPCAALQAHGKLLRGKLQRLHALLNTIDNTLHYLSEDNMSINEKELYAGFSKAEIAGMKAEVYQRFDSELIRNSQRRVQAMNKQQLEHVKQEQKAIVLDAATLIGQPVESEAIRALMRRQLAWLENFYPVSPRIFKGLGRMYVDDARFRKQYDVHGAGTAAFMRDAMAWYAANEM